MENEKVFLSQQLICMLPPLALKVMAYLLNWQRYDCIKYYENQMTKFMHITKEELEIAIQTLEDNNLIDISMVDQTYVIQINKATVKKYFEVPMQKIHDHDGIKMSEVVTWNKEEKQPSNDISDMSDKDIKTLLLRLQAQLNEREQTKKAVVAASVDDLPF